MPQKRIIFFVYDETCCTKPRRSFDKLLFPYFVCDCLLRDLLTSNIHMDESVIKLCTCVTLVKLVQFFDLIRTLCNYLKKI